MYASYTKELLCNYISYSCAHRIITSALLVGEKKRLAEFGYQNQYLESDW